MAACSKPLETKASSPFTDMPAEARKAARLPLCRAAASSSQVRFTEMDSRRRLRHPAYLGVREDKASRPR